MLNQVGYEIDFLPVGNGDRSGDAVAIRYGLPGNYKVLVYDGGTKESGKELVEHIKRHYHTKRVDYLVNSHPDADHASGLSVVMEELEVGELWMHRPWNYSSAILGYFKDGRITDNSLAEHLKEKMAAAYALEQIAEELDIPVREPFRGSAIGDFFVLSPEKDWYVHDLIAAFEKSPEQKEAEDYAALSQAGRLLKSMGEAVKQGISWIAERWDKECLREDVNTSAENESSVVLWGRLDGGSILLTGDAGVRALVAAADVAAANNISLPNELKVIQVPHHGSRHNVSTTVLNRIIGPPKAFDNGKVTMTAMISAGKDSTTHPRKMVVNAFIRRGAEVVCTQGIIKCHRHNMPDRGWDVATPLTFSNKVESWN